jgi:5'-methylthioinosine phosphorylase
MARIAIIGGTGAELFPHGQDATEISAAGKWGEPSSSLRLWTQGDHEILFLCRHGAEGGIPPHRVNYRANIAALAEQGVDEIIALNAVGGIVPGIVAGSLVIPGQLVDYTYGRAHSFFDSPNDRKQYIDFTEPYTQKIRDRLKQAADAAGVTYTASGVYGVTQGPRLETAAEIDRLERDGCSIVGMTSMPEAALAREVGLPYACLGLVVNAAAGRSNTAIHQDIERYLQSAVALAGQLILSYLASR